MDLLREIALLLAVALISLSGTVARAQQEVDPDHFDQPVAQAQKPAPVHPQKRAHSKVTKKGTAKHHHAHKSA